VCAAINAQPAPATLAPSGGSAPPPAIGAPAAPAGT